MNENDNFYPKTLPNPAASILILIGLWLVFAVVGMLFGMGALLLADIPLNDMMAFTQHPEKYPNGWYAMMAMQVFSSPLPFIAAAYVVWVLIEKQRFSNLFNRYFEPSLLILIGLLVIASLPLNGYIYELNKAMHLPEAFKGMETWMKDQEDSLAKLTEFITGYTGIGKLLIALLVIALSAGVAEELFFRGLLQNLLNRWFKNPHWAIWTAAVIFSAIHMQFYGFVPRVMLGAMFGYLYLWTGNLIVPIFAHFVNNAFAVIAAYLAKNNGVDIDISEKEVVPMPLLGASLVITIGLLWYVYKKTRKMTSNYGI